jgi:hypothetical protein
LIAKEGILAAGVSFAAGLVPEERIRISRGVVAAGRKTKEGILGTVGVRSPRAASEE